MLRLIQLLVFGHVHKWETVEVRPRYDDPAAKMPVGRNVYCKCVHCGAWKMFEL